jgi:hypothetical protein
MPDHLRSTRCTVYGRAIRGSRTAGFGVRTPRASQVSRPGPAQRPGVGTDKGSEQSASPRSGWGRAHMTMARGGELGISDGSGGSAKPDYRKARRETVASKAMVCTSGSQLQTPGSPRGVSVTTLASRPGSSAAERPWQLARVRPRRESQWPPGRADEWTGALRMMSGTPAPSWRSEVQVLPGLQAGNALPVSRIVGSIPCWCSDPAQGMRVRGMRDTTRSGAWHPVKIL